MKTVKLSEIADSIDYGVTASASEEPIGPKFLRTLRIFKMVASIGHQFRSVKPMRGNSHPLG